MLIAALCAGFGAAPAGAQTGDGAVRDSVYESDLVRPEGPADTTGRVVQTAGVTVQPVREPGAFSEPRYVMLRSLVVPGWGQFYNRQWLKGLLVAGVEVGLMVKIWQDDRDLARLEAQVQDARMNGSNAEEEAAILAYNDKLDSYVARQWLLGGAVAYALVDAYVDAHFRNFDIEFDADPGIDPGAAGGTRMRVALRWSF